MARFFLPAVSALVLLLTGCGGHSSGDAHDARATRDCLQDRPEYAGSLPANAGTAPTRTVLYVSGIHRYPEGAVRRTFDLDVVKGTERIDLFFDGPADETLSQLQTPEPVLLSGRKEQPVRRIGLGSPAWTDATGKLPERAVESRYGECPESVGTS